jgi:hypothetical protein
LNFGNKPEIKRKVFDNDKKKLKSVKMSLKMDTDDTDASNTDLHR